MDISQIISRARRSLWAIVVVLAAAFSAPAATLPIYINNAPFISPPAQTNIDAVAWWNRAYFNVFRSTGLPFESLNTRFFTNAAASFVGPYPAGTMIADPGLRFFNKVGSQKFWMDSWVNRGNITTDHGSSILFGGTLFFFNNSLASTLQVAATNITSDGSLSSGAHGLIRLEGNRINVSRSSLRTGSSAISSGILGTSFLGVSNYVNDVGVYDLYWGEGDGDALAAARRSAMRLDGLGFRPNFTLPSPSSTFHEVITPSTLSSFFFTNTTVVPGGSFFVGTNFFTSTNLAGYSAAVYTNVLDATSRVVQVVFYPTNSDPGFVTDVRFYDPLGGFGFGNPAIAVVGFHSTDFNIATETISTDSVYLSDGLATTTNAFLARNQTANTRRPSNYEVTRSTPFAYSLGTPGNAPFTSNLFYNSTFTRNTVTNRYAGYAAQVDLLSSSPSGAIPYDATNVPGRIEILGDEVNLDESRIRAESALIIKAGNLASNRLAQIDAPLINFDVRSVQPSLIISNLAPQSVRRLNGVVRAWSAAWDNFEAVPTATGFTTNTVSFHVLIVENQMRSQIPVIVNEFAARGTHIVINDLLNIRKSFVVEGDSFHLTGGLTLPLGVNLSSNTLLNVRNFTNDGVINISGSEFFGTDRPLPYLNYVNRGTNIAASHEIRTANFENPGCILANGGVFSLDALNATLTGPPLITSNYLTTNLFFLFPSGVTNIITTNTIVLQGAPKIEGASDVQIFAHDLSVSNSIINASTLLMSVTNRLVDSGPAATNLWSVSGGFNFMDLPTTSDLLGTHLRTTTARFGQAEHFWPAVNLGAVSAGFVNNLALGKLTFDGGDRSLFRLSGQPGTDNAIYVDYIELFNATTNVNGVVNSVFAIAPNLTIYFANANVPASRLDGAAGGRFRWVSSYTGPLSSTNITYPSGNTYTFNIALVTSTDLDSDGDGVANAIDPTPIYVAESAVLFVSLAAAPERCVELSWRALSYSSNYLEFRSSAQASGWQVLTNFHMGPFTWPVTVMDAISTNNASRLYRLRVDPGPY
jgi:hypothetical protein